MNFDAGARTQAASVFAAIGIAIVALALTPVLYYLPKATLAATIIVAVTSLIDVAILRRAWHYSRYDFTAVAITITATLLLGVELGVLSGILASIGLHLHKSTQPHMAIVGGVPGTEHFRNVERLDVVTHPGIISIRIDESLYFANASYLETCIYNFVAQRPELKHVILMCPAVNTIDLSALEVLEAINHRLAEQDISLNLSEVKGVVMDGLRRSEFLETGYWQDDIGRMVIEDKEGVLLGQILCFKPAGYMNALELAYIILRPEGRGKGYMTEAVRLFTNYLFDLHNINRIQLTVAVGNTGSKRVAEKCGFKSEGILRQAMFQMGRNVDIEMFSLLRDERPKM